MNIQYIYAYSFFILVKILDLQLKILNKCILGQYRRKTKQDTISNTYQTYNQYLMSFNTDDYVQMLTIRDSQ